MKRFLVTRSAILSVLLITAAVSVAAHHGWADFDRTKRVEINGVIVESRYENPHCFVRVQTEQANWAVELAAVPRMRRHAITPEMIKSGTRVILIGHPHKKKANQMKAIQITVGGKTYELTQ